MNTRNLVSDAVKRSDEIINHRTGERRKLRPDERFIPDGWGIAVDMMLRDAAANNAGTTTMSNATTISINDQQPETASIARRVLGDSTYAKKVAEPGTSMTRATINAFWGVDHARTEAQELGLFRAIPPLLDAGVKSMVDGGGASGAGGMTYDAWQRGGKPQDAYAERMADAWKGDR